MFMDSVLNSGTERHWLEQLCWQFLECVHYRIIMINSDTRVFSMWYFNNKRILNIIIMDDGILFIGNS